MMIDLSVWLFHIYFKQFFHVSRIPLFQEISVGSRGS